MKRIVMLSLAIIIAFFLAGNAEAGSAINTSNIFLMGYYNASTNINLSEIIKEFDTVTETTGQYVEGTMNIWYDTSDARDSRSQQLFERRDNSNTNVSLYSNVTIRARTDGWIVAWLTNDQHLNDIVWWDVPSSSTPPSDTTLGKAIWRITNRAGKTYNKNGVKYYSYKYPDAQRLLIGGSVNFCQYGCIDSTKIYSFVMPSSITLYEAGISYTSYIRDDFSGGSTHRYFAKVRLNTTYIYNKEVNSYAYSGIYEYSRNYQNLIDFPRDTKYYVYLETHNDYSGLTVLKSAVASLYTEG